MLHLCGWHSCGACLPPGTRPHAPCRWCGLCDGSRHEAPTDRASLQLLHGARRRRTQDACSPPAAGTLAKSACRQAPDTRHLHRLIEQACNCSTVRGRGRLKVRAASLPLAFRWRALAARHEAPGTRHHARCLAFATEAAMKLRLIEQACGCSTVRGRGRLNDGRLQSRLRLRG